MNLSATTSIYPIGTLRSQRGSAKPYIRGHNRSCAHQRVTLTLSNRTHRKARRITLTLNGKWVRTLTGRALQRDAVRVKHIPARSGGVIRARVVLKSGAVRKLRTTTWPCR